MTRRGTTRHGSLQFYPRCRAEKILPRVKWNAISKQGKGLMGFIGYKVGMRSAFVKDNTPNSMTKGKKIIIPVTILESPPIKILSVRFYKDKKIVDEVMNDALDKELKRKIKMPKKSSKQKIEEIEKKGDFDEIRIVAYSQAKKTGIKKTPDISEIGLAGTVAEKLEFAKNNFGKEILIKEVFKEGIVDLRGVTKGKGFQGSTKRFGLSLQQHKTEKGVRGPGSGGAWHPARVEFAQPMAGQMGFFTRIINNLKIVSINSINEKDINPAGGFEHFGKIKNDYVIVEGSVQGPVKRAVLITSPLRANKKHLKKNYELIELR